MYRWPFCGIIMMMEILNALSPVGLGRLGAAGFNIFTARLGAKTRVDALAF
jgi:hypothetical protein